MFVAFEQALFTISDWLTWKQPPKTIKTTRVDPVEEIKREQPPPNNHLPMFDREVSVRALFEEYFKKPFPKTRPQWLVNDYTNQKLELDGYCEELKLAFEFQGPDHYQKFKYNNTDDKLKKQLFRDGHKRFECMRHGVMLIEIPYWKTKDQIREILSRFTI